MTAPNDGGSKSLQTMKGLADLHLHARLRKPFAAVMHTHVPNLATYSRY